VFVASRILLLLACLPLFVPPGVCVCGASEAVASLVRTEPDAAEAVPAGDSCDCCNPAARELISPEPQPTRPHQHHHDDHAPGCPASGGAGGSKWVEPSGSASCGLFAAPPTPGLCVTLQAELPQAQRLAARASTPCVGPPLYLSHCALLF
jgi:hypothetical protein